MTSKTSHTSHINFYVKPPKKKLQITVLSLIFQYDQQNQSYQSHQFSRKTSKVTNHSIKPYITV